MCSRWFNQYIRYYCRIRQKKPKKIPKFSQWFVIHTTVLLPCSWYFFQVGFLPYDSTNSIRLFQNYFSTFLLFKFKPIFVGFFFKNCYQIEPYLTQCSLNWMKITKLSTYSSTFHPIGIKAHQTLFKLDWRLCLSKNINSACNRRIITKRSPWHLIWQILYPVSFVFCFLNLQSSSHCLWLHQ